MESYPITRQDLLREINLWDFDELAIHQAVWILNRVQGEFADHRDFIVRVSAGTYPGDSDMLCIYGTRDLTEAEHREAREALRAKKREEELLAEQAKRERYQEYLRLKEEFE